MCCIFCVRCCLFACVCLFIVLFMLSVGNRWSDCGRINSEEIKEPGLQTRGSMQLTDRELHPSAGLEEEQEGRRSGRVHHYMLSYMLSYMWGITALQGVFIFLHHDFIHTSDEFICTFLLLLLLHPSQHSLLSKLPSCCWFSLRFYGLFYRPSARLMDYWPVYVGDSCIPRCVSAFHTTSQHLKKINK